MSRIPARLVPLVSATRRYIASKVGQLAVDLGTGLYDTIELLTLFGLY
jgi:hypothetical protein